MRRFLKTGLLVLVWFVSRAPGCNGRPEMEAKRENERQEAFRDSLAAAFSTDTLPAATLHTFEMTAVGKLSDLADYMKIFTDTSADNAFREKSREMTVNLFINGAVRLEPYLFMQENTDFRVRELKTMKLNILRPMVFRYDSVHNVQPMRQVSDTLCTGSLGFVLADPAGRFASDRKISEILAVKRMKLFGSDTLMVWEVKLGDMLFTSGVFTRKGRGAHLNNSNIEY
jgi:hypothetical protein